MKKTPAIQTWGTVAALAALGLSGCVPAAVTGVSTLGYAAAQERTVGDAVDDVTIATQINSKFVQKDVNNLFQGIDVDVSEGRVLLTGDVKNPADRVEAVRMAWQVDGVKEVINEIQIAGRTSMEDMARDAWITTQVKSKLLLERTILSINYSVDTVNRVVYLMGIAQDQAEMNRAALVASRVKGVRKVISHVRVKDDPRRHQ